MLSMVPLFYTPIAKKSPFIETQERLQTLKQLASDFEKNNQTGIDLLLQESPENLPSVDRVFWVFQEASGDEKVLFSNYVDGWGLPFNVDYKTNFTDLPEKAYKSLENLTVVIWSNGPNNENEFGKNDDILW